MLDADVDVVVTTAYTAVARLAGKVRPEAENGPLFDTLCVDEAGLISAPLVAALSVLAANRAVSWL